MFQLNQSREFRLFRSELPRHLESWLSTPRRDVAATERGGGNGNEFLQYNFTQDDDDDDDDGIVIMAFIGEKRCGTAVAASHAVRVIFSPRFALVKSPALCAR